MDWEQAGKIRRLQLETEKLELEAEKIRKQIQEFNPRNERMVEVYGPPAFLRRREELEDKKKKENGEEESFAEDFRPEKEYPVPVYGTNPIL